MRIKVLALVISLCLVPSASVGIPQTPSAVTSAPQRDAHALTILGQAAAAAGWTTALLPPAVIGTGKITNFSGDTPQVQSFTLKQRGSLQQRLDVLDNGFITTTVVNGLAGIILFGDGTKHRLPLHSAISVTPPAFPFFTDLANISDPNLEIQDPGTDTIDGTLCHGVSVVRHAIADDKVGKFRDLAAPLKVWISQQSGLPVRIDFVRLAGDNPYLQMHFSRSFSDYRFVNGVAIAFTQEERFEGQLFSRFQFTDVQFSSALTDADFDTSKL